MVGEKDEQALGRAFSAWDAFGDVFLGLHRFGRDRPNRFRPRLVYFAPLALLEGGKGEPG